MSKNAAKVKILIQGYTSADRPGAQEKTCPTITLLRDGRTTIIVDPGVLADRKVLIKALKKEGLSPDKISAVFLTHSHIDHFANTGMFPKATIIEYYGCWKNDVVTDRPKFLSENIQILETPGHSFTGLTLLAKTSLGTVAVCGDVFWKENYPRNDQYADNRGKLKDSRKKLLKLADYIIPGHAGMFKVK